MRFVPFSIWLPQDLDLHLLWKASSSACLGGAGGMPDLAADQNHSYHSYHGGFCLLQCRLLGISWPSKSELHQEFGL